MTSELFFIALLATYRLTIMLNSESGPGDIFGHLRARMGVQYDEHSNPYGTNWIAEGVLCFFCLSVWIALGISALVLVALSIQRDDWVFWLLFPFALSGGAIFLKKYAG